MQFPLDIRFKILALTGKITATGADGQTAFFVKQKLLALKENIEVYTDSTQTTKLFTVKADRIIDFSPEFIIYDANDTPVGSLKRHGRRSIWKAHYEITIGNTKLNVDEANPWTKFLDGVVGEILIINFFTGFFLHPKYNITGDNGQAIGHLVKNNSFFERKYSLEAPAANFDDKSQVIFAVLMMVVCLRERARG